MISITTGNIAASQRPAWMDTSVSSSLVRRNRSVSRGSRTNARTTRMPVICSRSTRFTPSMRSCTSRKLGTIRLTMRPTESSSAGTTTASSQESPRFSRIAIRMPPTIMIGTVAPMVQAICTSICTCCTSLVPRVISEAGPKLAISRPEKEPTRWKMSARRSRPAAIAVRDPNQTAAMEQAIWSRETRSITPPMRRM